MWPAVAAAAICLAGAGAEAIFAGRGVQERLKTLKQPRLSPPFGVWIVVGIAYYAICFTLLLRIFRTDWRAGPGRLPLLLLLVLMSINALWNLYFFRRRDLRGGFVLSIIYVPVALALTVTLARLGDGSAWIFAPYLAYLVYGGYYGYATWRLNSG